MKKYFVILVAFMAVTTGLFAQINFSISPVKMNVLYLGIDNPLSISISGVPDEKVSVAISHGTISKVSGNEYIARPAKTGDAKVEVFTEIDGQSYTGIMEFRVKMLPIPIAKIAGKSGGNIEKADLLAQKGIIVDMEDFLFDMRYTVTQFTVVVASDKGDRGSRSNSATFTSDQKELLNSLEKGTRVAFTDIRASGPNGVVDLRDIVFAIN